MKYALTFLFLMSVATSADARGPSLADLFPTLDIRAICQPNANTILLYPEYDIRMGRGCPLGAVVVITSSQKEMTSLEAAEKAGVEVKGSGALTLARFTYEVYNIRVQTPAGQPLIEHALDATTMSNYLAQLKTLTREDPVSISLDYPAKRVAKLEGNPHAESRVEIKIVATCKEMPSGKVFGYSKSGAPSTAEFCPPAYQVSFETAKEKSDSKNYNSVKKGEFGSGEYQTITNRILISSRFGNPIFEQKVSAKILKQALLDFTTASPENPVRVVIDRRAKVILNIAPSISPFAL